MRGGRLRGRDYDLGMGGIFCGGMKKIRCLPFAEYEFGSMGF